MDPTVAAAAIGVSGTVIVGVTGYVAGVMNASKTTALTLRAIALSEQGQVAARYSNAIEQLGSDRLDVRIGGIYALERIARDSPRDHPTVMEVLASFIKEHSEWLHDAIRDAQDTGRDPGMTGRDLQAAITVLGRRDAKLTGANLADAILTSADLTRVHLAGADLADADLADADLTGAILTGAILTRAILTRADLTYADLTSADLTSAELTDAKLTDAKLTSADLTGAHWSLSAVVPGGWQRDTYSACLTRSEPNSVDPSE
jgi:Pentapeptide repeats (8 copies)